MKIFFWLVRLFEKKEVPPEVFVAKEVLRLSREIDVLERELKNKKKQYDIFKLNKEILDGKVTVSDLFVVKKDIPKGQEKWYEPKQADFNFLKRD